MYPVNSPMESLSVHPVTSHTEGLLEHSFFIFVKVGERVDVKSELRERGCKAEEYYCFRKENAK